MIIMVLLFRYISDIKPYAPSQGAGLPGNYTGASGFLSYYEICDAITKQKWSTGYDKEQQVPFAYKDDQWVGYDNQQSIEQKCSYIAKRCLAGAMIWSLDLDDFNGSFCKRTTPKGLTNRGIDRNLDRFFYCFISFVYIIFLFL